MAHNPLPGTLYAAVLTVVVLAGVVLGASGSGSTSQQPQEENVSSSSFVPIEDLRVVQISLFDHPPVTFSPDFTGHSQESPNSVNSTLRVLSFNDTFELCKHFFVVLYGENATLNWGTYWSKFGDFYYVFTDERYKRVCLPMVRTFEPCQETEFLTICPRVGLVFVHAHNCVSSANSIYLATFFMDNNTECFEAFCEGRLNVVDSETNGVQFRVTNSFYSDSGPSCGYLTQNYLPWYDTYNGSLYYLLNEHWACCYASYLVIWGAHPESHGLNGAWSFLPVTCQAAEIMLILMILCLGVSGVAGNLVVLVVMLSGKRWCREESSLLRTSLAFSDLLISSFVIVPSFLEHVALFLKPLPYVVKTVVVVHEPVQEDLNSENATSTELNTDKTSEWYYLVQNLLFSTMATNSLLTLVLLSVDRFIITGRFLQYWHYLSLWKVKLIIAVCWIVSIVKSFVYAMKHDDTLSTQRLTFEKLPTGVSGEEPWGVLYSAFYEGHQILHAISGATVIIFSILAIWNYRRNRSRVSEEWTQLKMRANKVCEEEDRYVTVTMVLMLLFFLLESVPISLELIFVNTDVWFPRRSVYSYFAWWLFVAGSAWNPWIYNFRGMEFRRDARRLLQRVGCLRKYTVTVEVPYQVNDSKKEKKREKENESEPSE